MRNISLRWKLLFFFLVIALVPIVFLMIYTARLVEETIDLGLNKEVERSLNDGRELLNKLSTKEQEHLVNYLSLISGNAALVSSVSSGHKQTMTERLEGIQRRYLLGSIQIYDPQGRYLAGYPRERDVLLARSAARQAIDKGIPYIIDFSFYERRVIGAAPLFYNEKLLGIIVGEHLLSGIYAEKIEGMIATLGRYQELLRNKESLRRRYYLQMWMAAMSLLLAAMLISYFITRWIMEPVRRLITGTEKIAAGNLDAHLGGASGDELGRLTSAFNKMTVSLRDYRARLGEAQRLNAWRDVARAVAHEIKNPLTSIQLSVQYLKDKHATGKREYRDVLEICVANVLEQTESMRLMATAFSEFATLPRARKKIFQPAQALQELTTAVSRQAKVKLELSPGTEVMTLKADGAHFRRAVLNLIQNGLRAQKGAARLGLSLATSRGAKGMEKYDLELGRLEKGPLPPLEENDYLVVRVRDRGRGIQRQDRGKLFQKYFTRSQGGSGLGLVVIERIMHEHGGAVVWRSKVGKGSAFYLMFPL